MSLKYCLVFAFLFSNCYNADTVAADLSRSELQAERNSHGSNQDQHATTTDSTPISLCEKTDYFRCPQRDGRFPHPTNCSLYYRCNNYCATKRECTAPLRFNAVKNTCEIITTNFCVKPPKPLKGDIFEGMDHLFHCPRDGVFPHPEFCEKYYSCMNAGAYIYTCKGKLFDSRYNSCNYPELTPCGHRERPDDFPGSETITPPPLTTTTIPSYQCREIYEDNKSYYYQDPDDCAKFFVCFNGKVISYDTCKNDTLFDERISNCNHREFVICNVL